jgi:hypothetical protein
VSHWTQELKTENAALRVALDTALLALRTIPQSRLDKAQRCPDQDACCDLAYVTCAREVDRLGVATVQDIRDRLAEAGAL